jgi:hypothetical protein
VHGILCGVAQKDSTNDQTVDWPVLWAVMNPQFNRDSLLQSVSGSPALHVFASTSAWQFFVNSWHSLSESEKKQRAQLEMFACGVGDTTDRAARSLPEAGVQLRWSTPRWNSSLPRENGLLWTLNQLETLGLIPRYPLYVWTKTWSNSENILCDFKHSRQWPGWQSSIKEIYSLKSEPFNIPEPVLQALQSKQNLCFGVKSADVLDATLASLIHHLKVPSVAQLPNFIHFSVWEQSALKRAQQLFLQWHLIDWLEFEKLCQTNDMRALKL